jgi:hypothetical protein
VNSESCRWLTLACLMLSTAHAGDIDKRSATLSVQGDSNDNRQWLGKVALPLSDSVWAQASLGKFQFGTDGANDSAIVGAALGAGGQNFSTAIEFAQRKGDSGFNQQSWGATVDWHGSRGNLGADVSVRSAKGTSTTTQSSDVAFGRPVTTTVRESVNGTGFGVHGDFALTSRVIVFAGAMRYRYDFDVESSTSANNSTLSSLLGLDNAGVAPGAWREQAFVDRSYRIGSTYLFDSAAISAQLFRDHVTNSDETFSTVQLQAEIPFAQRWIVNPTLGRSANGSAGDVTYGGINLRFIW